MNIKTPDYLQFIQLNMKHEDYFIPKTTVKVTFKCDVEYVQDLMYLVKNRVVKFSFTYTTEICTYTFDWIVVDIEYHKIHKVDEETRQILKEEYYIITGIIVATEMMCQGPAVSWPPAKMPIVEGNTSKFSDEP